MVKTEMNVVTVDFHVYMNRVHFGRLQGFIVTAVGKK